MLNGAMNHRDLSREIQDMVLMISTKVGDPADKSNFYGNLVKRAPAPLKALLLNLCKKAGEANPLVDTASVFLPFINDMLTAVAEDGEPDFEKLMANRECYCEAVIYLSQSSALDAVAESGEFGSFSCWYLQPLPLTSLLSLAVRGFRKSLAEGMEGKDDKWQLMILASALERI